MFPTLIIFNIFVWCCLPWFTRSKIVILDNAENPFYTHTHAHQKNKPNQTKPKTQNKATEKAKNLTDRQTQCENHAFLVASTCCDKHLCNSQHRGRKVWCPSSRDFSGPFVGWPVARASVIMQYLVAVAGARWPNKASHLVETQKQAVQEERARIP